MVKRNTRQAGKKAISTKTRECIPELGWEAQCNSCQGWHRPEMSSVKQSREEIEKDKWTCPPCRRVYAMELQIEELCKKMDDRQKEFMELQEQVGRLRAEKEQQVQQRKHQTTSDKMVTSNESEQGVKSSNRSYASVVSSCQSLTNSQKARLAVDTRTHQDRRLGETIRTREKLGKVLLLSDSIVTHEVCRDLREKIGNVTEITPLRYPGLTTRGLKRIVLQSQIHKRGWTLVIVHCGSNDGPCPRRNKSGFHPLETVGNLLSVASCFKNYGSQVVIDSILPRRDRGLHAHWCDDSWSRQVNSIMKQQISQLSHSFQGRVRIQDLTECYCTFRNATPWVYDGFFQADGVHLSKSGKELLGIIYAKEVCDVLAIRQYRCHV